MTDKELINLWGDVIESGPLRQPVTILREQASILTRLTKGVLQGEVKSNVVSGHAGIDFNIVVPALNDYSYNLLTVTHDLLKFYPLMLMTLPDYEKQSARDEGEFMAILASILGSKDTHTLIQSLLAQSGSVEEAPL